ncbi:SRPBCC family protein [Subtercola sp. YIM 133946]|uniref:SRPBCC family protein n=1 Tax=Subtercola sp. YIM 133946 TaxID=3118909 RepID=UPI002F946E46
MQPKPVLFTAVGVSFSEPQFAFDVIVPRDDSTLFTGYLGVLPAVVGLENHGETYGAAGDSRTVFLSDGGSFREQIVRYERPAEPSAAGHFDYDVTQFTGVLSHIVSDASARWSYAPGTPGRTHITWSYAYRPLPGRTLLVRRVIGPLWRRYMRRSMLAVLAAIVAERP